MNVSVACIIPYALRFELECVDVRGQCVVRVCVRGGVAPAADVSADEADPEVCGGGAGGTGGEC